MLAASILFALAWALMAAGLLDLLRHAPRIDQEQGGCMAYAVFRTMTYRGPGHRPLRLGLGVLSLSLLCVLTVTLLAQLRARLGEEVFVVLAVSSIVMVGGWGVFIWGLAELLLACRRAGLGTERTATGNSSPPQVHARLGRRLTTAGVLGGLVFFALMLLRAFDEEPARIIDQAPLSLGLALALCCALRIVWAAFALSAYMLLTTLVLIRLLPALGTAWRHEVPDTLLVGVGLLLLACATLLALLSAFGARRALVSGPGGRSRSR